MFRLMLAMFAFLWTSTWRPEDPPPDDDNPDDPPQDPTEDKGGKFSQEDVDRIVSERLERERKKQEADQEKRDQKAKEETLKEQGKYKEIAEQQATKLEEKDNRISELEGKETEVGELKTKYEELETRYAKLIEDRLSVVPEPYQPLLEQMGVTERADWIEANAEKLGVERKPSGSRPTPRPGRDSRRESERDEEARRQHASAVRTGF